MSCLTWICRNHSPLYKYLKTQFVAPQPIRTQRRFYQASADGTQLEPASYQLFSSDYASLHLTTKSVSSSQFRIQVQYQTVFPYFLLQGLYMVIFFFASIGQILCLHPCLQSGLGSCCLEHGALPPTHCLPVRRLKSLLMASFMPGDVLSSRYLENREMAVPP